MLVMQRKKFIYCNKVESEPKVLFTFSASNQQLLSGGQFPVSGIKHLKSG
jgi:hypothetical protein